MTDAYRAPKPEPPSFNCEVCSGRFPVASSFYDGAGRQVCFGCKGKGDAAAATTQAKKAQGSIPYSMVGGLIALIGLAPIVYVKSRGNLGVMCASVVVVGVIFAVVVAVQAKNNKQL